MAAVLFVYDPARGGYYPVCYFHRWTGLLCPGCGGLRAAHQILHWNWGAAWRLNPLLVCGLPLGAAAGAYRLWARMRHPERSMKLRPGWLWGALFVIVAFGILRNLPVAAHVSLAP